MESLKHHNYHKQTHHRLRLPAEDKNDNLHNLARNVKTEEEDQRVISHLCFELNH